MKKTVILTNALSVFLKLSLALLIGFSTINLGFTQQNRSIPTNKLTGLAQSSQAAELNQDEYLDQFDDESEDLEALKQKAIEQKQKTTNKKTLLESLKEYSAKSNAVNSTKQTTTKDKSNKSDKTDNLPADFMEQVKNTLRFGTYDEQKQLLKRMAGECRRKILIEKITLDNSKEVERTQEVIKFLKEQKYYENAFKKDGTLLLANLELIQNCNMVEEVKFIERILLEEHRYMDYPEITRIALKIKAWEIIADFYPQLVNTDKENYAKLSEQYYRYDRYHNNDARIKRAALVAAGKLLPEKLNQVLKQDYEQETNLDLKNTMLETISFYRDVNDIDFYDKIIKDPEGTKMHRWISVIAFTNYAPNQNALAKLKEYTQISESEIASRAYYVLGFYELSVDYFIEATKNNDDNIRLQAIEALAQFPLAEISDILKYKSVRDSNETVRKKAKDILEQKKSN